MLLSSWPRCDLLLQKHLGSTCFPTSVLHRTHEMFWKNLLNWPWIFRPFLPTFAGDIKRDITVFSKQKKRLYIVHCFLVSLIRNQYKWCFKYLQVLFDKAMAIYAQLFHFRQQLRLLTYRNLVGQNPEMQNATMQNLHTKKHAQQFTQSSLSCIKLYLMTMNQTENPWVLCFCSASLPQPNLGDRFPIGFSWFFFSKKHRRWRNSNLAANLSLSSCKSSSWRGFSCREDPPRWPPTLLIDVVSQHSPGGAVSTTSSPASPASSPWK